MIENFDITMTATLRPQLIKTTLDSHIECLFKDHAKKARLIINVDMAGMEKNKDLVFGEVMGVVDKYKFKGIALRKGEPPHFPMAFFWCWDQVRTPFVFHLEEDWEMKYELSFEKMWELMEKDEDLVHLRLSQFISTRQTCKNWNKFTHWNGEYFEVSPDDRGVIGWCGHPSLNRLSFMKTALAFAERDKNPEKQIKGRRYYHPINDLFSQSRFGVYTPQDHDSVEKDIGRKWMVDNGYVKDGNKAFFTNWRKAG